MTAYWLIIPLRLKSVKDRMHKEIKSILCSAIRGETIGCFEKTIGCFEKTIGCFSETTTNKNF